MYKEWLNNKEPDANGDYVLVIKNANGARISTFKGKSIEEVAEALADSQVHANRVISQLRKPDTGKSAISVTPQAITPSDRLRYAEDISDPEKVVEVVEEIFTRRSGLAPNRVGAEFGRMSKEQQDAYYAAEANAFTAEHPDYYPVPQNRDQIFDELRANGWDLTRNNLALAFETLKDRGSLVPWPNDSQAQEEEEPIPQDYMQPQHQPGFQNGNGSASGGTTAPAAAPAPRPRSVSTSLRRQDASASAPPPPQKKKYTRADVERMSRAEYNEKLRSDPDFRRQVDAMG
jgi:hypothetical protein